MAMRAADLRFDAGDNGTDIAAMARDVRRDLARKPKQLQPRYFYDALGSRLFDAICALPWYGITRAEMRLLDKHGRAIAAAADLPGAVVDLGCGSGVKTALLLQQAGGPRVCPLAHLVDVSREALAVAERALGRITGLTVVKHRASYEDGLSAAVAARSPRPVLVLFFGSNIGTSIHRLRPRSSGRSASVSPQGTASSSGPIWSSPSASSSSPTTTRSG